MFITALAADRLTHSAQHQPIEPRCKRGGILRQFTIENLRLLQQQKRDVRSRIPSANHSSVRVKGYLRPFCNRAITGVSDPRPHRERSSGDRSGHGFGLHSAALAAGELGGKLTAHSDGEGYGAKFVLVLPVSPPESARG